jgi:hypothetical protein
MTTAGIRVEIRNQGLRKILCMSFTLCNGNAEVLEVTWPSSIPDSTVLRSVKVDQQMLQPALLHRRFVHV